jgi:hypothetical protein
MADVVVSRFDVLTLEECHRAYRDIYALQPAWTQRDNLFPVPFYTLGAASYLDARSWEHFHEQARRLNRLLESRFDWLYRKLQQVLAEHLGLDIAYHPDLSRPGFHVFPFDTLSLFDVSSRHRDLQYQRIPWQALGIDACDPLSFTLSIRLPASGAGLYVWLMDHAETGDQAATDWQALPADAPCELHAYREGEMVMHDALLFHQVAPLAHGRAGDERITLQAHGIRDGRTLYVYW